MLLLDNNINKKIVTDFIFKNKITVFILIQFTIIAIGIFMGRYIEYYNYIMLSILILSFLVLLTFNLSIPELLCLSILIVYVPLRQTVGTLNSYLYFWIFVIILFQQSKSLKKTPLDIPIFLLALAHLLSFFNVTKHNFANSIFNTIVVFSCICLYFFTVMAIRNRSTLRLILKSLFVLWILEIVTGVYQLLLLPNIPLFEYIGFRPLSMYSTRPYGSFLDSFTYAFFMVIAFIFFLYFYAKSDNMKFKLAYSVAMLLCLIMVFSVVSRAAIVCLLIGAFLFVIRFAKQLKKIRITQIVLVVTLFMVITLITFSLYAYTSANIIERTLNLRFAESMIPYTRGALWQFYFNEIQKHIIIGQGYIDMTVYEIYHATGTMPYIFGFPHSTYLFYLYTTGIIGLFAFLFFMLKLLISNRKFLNNPEYKQCSSYLWGLLSVFQIVFILLLIWSVTMEYQRTITFQHLLWFLFGLNVAISRLMLKERTPNYMK